MSNLENAIDLGQGIYDKSEIDNKPTGFKNLIINGGFNVWQRSTSYACTAGHYGYYTADRLRSANVSDGQFTVSKVVTDGRNSVKVNVDTAVTDLTGSKYWSGQSYMFEGQDLYTLAYLKKTVTLSFIFNSNVVGKYPVVMRNRTDQSNGTNSYVTTFDYVKANTAQKIEVQIPLDYTFNPALENDNTMGFSIEIAFLNEGDYVTSTTEAWVDTNSLTTTECVNWGATAGNFVSIAELQLEEGSVATPFENRPYGLELSLCQRYYEKFNYGGSSQLFSMPIVYGYCRLTMFFKEVKRITPSLKVVNFSDAAGGNVIVSYPVDRSDRYRYTSANSKDFGSGDKSFKFVSYEADSEL
jgi:hypothetical protein